MINQKGLAFIPLLFWIAISVIGVAAVGEAAGLHLSLNNLPTTEVNNSYTDPSPSLIPSSLPSPIPTVLPKINNNQVDNSNSQKDVQGVATHDGTRTGNIIKYKEWCKGNQEISIYENELIAKKTSDGKTYTMTQGDWDCYEKRLKDSAVPATPQVQNNQSVINWGKVAELKNILAEVKRLGAASGVALSQLQFYQELQSHCSRPIYADEAKTIPFSPSQSEGIYNNCLSQYQPLIDQNRRIVEDSENKVREYRYRANILAAECPKCWEEAQK